jgi:hypothetical protein
MGRRKIGGPPQGRKANKINLVAAAVEIAGGPTAVARLCGVRPAIDLSVDQGMEGRKIGRRAEIVARLRHSD